MKTYNLWTRIEVYDSETDTYQDLDPAICEYKIGEAGSVEDLVNLLEGICPREDFIEQEITTALEQL